MDTSIKAEKMLNSQQEQCIQKNDRNIYELYATPAILPRAMIFYQTLEDVCDRKLTGILNNECLNFLDTLLTKEPVIYYSTVQ